MAADSHPLLSADDLRPLVTTLVEHVGLPRTREIAREHGLLRDARGPALLKKRVPDAEAAVRELRSALDDRARANAAASTLRRMARESLDAPNVEPRSRSAFRKAQSAMNDRDRARASRGSRSSSRGYSATSPRIGCWGCARQFSRACRETRHACERRSTACLPSYFRSQARLTFRSLPQRASTRISSPRRLWHRLCRPHSCRARSRRWRTPTPLRMAWAAFAMRSRLRCRAQRGNPRAPPLVTSDHDILFGFPCSAQWPT